MKFIKLAALVFGPTLALLIGLETLARIAYYQRHYLESPSAAYSMLSSGYRSLQMYLARRKVGSFDTKRLDLLLTERAPALVTELESRYRSDFQSLSALVKSQNVPLLVMYLPSDDYVGKARLRDDRRSFFGSLAREHEHPFVDLTSSFLEYPPETVTLLPFNGHLSRFGCGLAADAIEEWIKNNPLKRSSVTFSSRPRLLGDLSPKSSSIWDIEPSSPYRVVTNSQGLRHQDELEFPKTKLRVLVLGDSFTFGPYLPNHDTYPAILDERLQDVEVINAGVASYTLQDVVELYRERAQFIEPDLIVLQVLDNDISDYMALKRNYFNRARQVFQPSKLETEFLTTSLTAKRDPG